MIFLYLGIFIFFSIHMLPSIVPLHRSIQSTLGAGPYKGVYSLLALTGLGLIVYGKAVAPYIDVWLPPEWTRQILRIVMLPVLLLLVAANMPSNVKRFTPHPMMWGVLIWSLAHLSVNGDLASMCLFGSFGLFAIVHIVSANKRGATLQTETLVFSSDIKVAVIGFIAYVAIASAHPYLFKVAAF